MQIEVNISEDRLSATVGEQTLRVNGPITYKNLDGILTTGTVMLLAVYDKKDMKSPWAHVRENKSGEGQWVPLRTWAMLGLPSQTAAPVVPVADINEMPWDESLVPPIVVEEEISEDGLF